MQKEPQRGTFKTSDGCEIAFQVRSARQAMPFATDLFARDLAELLDHVGWPTAVVAGCSMGGCVAQTFAGLYPARASALGLIDTTAWYGDDASKQWRERGAAARSNGLAG